MSMILDGTNGVTFNDSSLQGAAASPYGLKNRLINSDMRIDQRNAGASVALTGSSKYAVDRFVSFYTNTGGAATAQQSSVAPAGFTNSLLYSVTTGAAIGTGDYSCIQQNIEGYNVADLDYGLSTAKTITLSFWVRSSLTGTFSGALNNSAANRSYVYTYTISAANTWEYKTITITGDTTGTWLKTNGSGLLVYWNMGFQSASLTSTTNTWLAGAFNGVVGGVTPSTTTGATFYLTGVQLEIGTSATPFERRLIGTEIALCQRYYEQMKAGLNLSYAAAIAHSNSNARVTIPFQVSKRASPTMTYAAAGTFYLQGNNGNIVPTAVTDYGATIYNDYIGFTVTATQITQGHALMLIDNTGASFIQASAEL